MDAECTPGPAHADEDRESGPAASKSQELNAAAYIYPVLEPSHIRIIVLEPTFDNNAPLHFSFRSASLPDLRGQYEAISYTWGEPKLAFPLHRDDGSPVSVTANLDMTLRRLRHRLDERWLLADAVCIDQGNPEEKATQIPMMDKTYRSAKRVLAWRGPGGDDAEEGMLLLERHSQSPYEFHTSMITTVDAEEVTKSITLTNRFFALPWFRRMWTIQECIQSSSVDKKKLRWQGLLQVCVQND
jgi:hypothetical protein